MTESRTKTKKGASKAPTVAEARKRLAGGTGFWETLTPSQKKVLLNWDGPEIHGPQKTPRRKSLSVEKRAPTRAEARERLSKGLGWIENLTEDQKKILDSIEGPAFLGRPRKPKRRG
jgi:hypothetical protein